MGCGQFKRFSSRFLFKEDLGTSEGRASQKGQSSRKAIENQTGRHEK